MTIEQNTADSGVAVAAEDKVNGPAIAATLAVGIGCLALGIFVILAEASASAKDFLELNKGVGPLSGKTTFAVLIYLVSWGGLYALMKDRELPWKPYIYASVILIALGVLFTFPTFFMMFASE